MVVHVPSVVSESLVVQVIQNVHVVIAVSHVLMRHLKFPRVQDIHAAHKHRVGVLPLT